MATKQPTLSQEEIEFRRGYVRVHRALTRVRGRARDHGCVDCGEPAQAWSYNNSGVAEVILATGGAVPLRYSNDVAQYEPRCSPCHVTFDRDFRRAGEAAEWAARVQAQKWERALAVLETVTVVGLPHPLWTPPT